MEPRRFDKLKRLLLHVRDLPTDRRRSYLESECRDDPELVQEALSLLEQDAATGGFLEVGSAARLLEGEASLERGAKLGHYEVLARIGSGGMGTVYRARDTRLGRDVAIKILPLQSAMHPGGVARFERESRLLAALSHPNIAAIHDVDQVGGIPFLVLELVHGETLRELLAQAKLPLDRALDVCGQVAAAIEYAHENGVVHRDLKPGNVIVSPDGTVKVLDFGLAKALASPSESDVAPAPDEETRPGLVLGTAAYMSPEQARGMKVDRRGDIWAFGCLLYEALSGRQAFPGPSDSDSIASVLKQEPDWGALPASTPPAIVDLLQRCLQKDRNERLQHMGDARIEISRARRGLSGRGRWARGRWGASGPGPRAVLWGGTGFVIGSIATAISVSQLSSGRRPVAVHDSVHLALTLPGDKVIDFGRRWRGAEALTPSIPIDISSDGERVVFSAIGGDTSQLHVRTLDAYESQPIPGTALAIDPFFSPSGEEVGFFAAGKLKKVSLRGGAPVDLCIAPSGTGGSWGTDGTIVFSPSYDSGLMRVRDTGGTPEILTQLDPQRGEQAHVWPRILPGGRAILFTIEMAGRPYDEAEVVAMDLETRERQVLVRGTCARYASSGHLVYGQASALWAAPFDASRLRLTGAAEPVLESVSMGPGRGQVQYAVADNGTLVYLPGRGREAERTLVRVDRTGRAEPLSDIGRRFVRARFSPVDASIAVQITGANDDLWLLDPGRGALSRLTFEAENHVPVWAPDGRKVAFRSNRSHNYNIFSVPVDGSGTYERLTTAAKEQRPSCWTAEGNVLVFEELDAETGWDIWALDLASPETPQPLIRTRFAEFQPRVSPDGRWLAYVSDESGRNEVHLQSFPRPTGKRQVSVQGGSYPVWGPDGGEIFFRDGDKLLAATLTGDAGLPSGVPRVLFEGPYLLAFDVASDGRSFLMIQKSLEETMTRQVNVVLHWADRLQRRRWAGKT